MKAEELHSVMREWGINAAQLAKVLCLHTNKMSEYLAGVEKIPCAIAFSVEALNTLPPDERNALIEQRLKRVPHAHKS